MMISSLTMIDKGMVLYQLRSARSSTMGMSTMIMV